jgi:N-methylhydantoinase A
MTLRAAVDIGGTFTDVVAYDDSTGDLHVGKALSTPHDLIDGVGAGLAGAAVGVEAVDFLIHGTTVVVNALIERKGARTALLTTAGFRDVYEIGRINRPDAFNLSFRKHEPLVRRSMIFEVTERLRADGTVSVPVDDDEVRAIARRLDALGVEAVAVVLLHAYRQPRHEVRVGEILSEELPGRYITLSHEISREYREFERTSTVAANAFVGPLVSDYLRRLDERLRTLGSTAPLAIMQSNGGIADVATAAAQCVQMLESGPAGGVVGTIALCEQLGRREAIAFDMGGTTAKSAVIRDLTLPTASDYFLGGYNTGLPMRIPCLDIVEVGTGGGSVAWLDDASGVHVGPQSAGADPGPACYGRGGADPTITDATVVLGHLAAGGQLVGGMPLDGDAAQIALEKLAGRLGMDVTATAAGIVSIGAASMANSVRAVTTERGLDPRDFTLFAYGGNGPLHISLVARELGITSVIVPPIPSVFSALGMLMADVRVDVVQTEVRNLGATGAAELEAAFASLERACEERLTSSALSFDGLRFLRAADMRYVGQEHTVTVPVPDAGGADAIAALKRAFDQAHGERYSHNAPAEPAQIVSLRVSAFGELRKPTLARLQPGGPTPAADARTGTRGVVFDAAVGWLDTPVYCRAALAAGNRITGPAVVEEPTATVLLRPVDELEVDELGNLNLRIGS